MSTLPPYNLIERRLQHNQQIIVFHITWKMMLKSLLSNNSSIPHSHYLINQCDSTTHCSNKTPSTLTQLQFINLYHVCSTWCSQHKSPHHTTLIHHSSSFLIHTTHHLESLSQSHHSHNCLSEWKQLDKTQNIHFEKSFTQ